MNRKILHLRAAAGNYYTQSIETVSEQHWKVQLFKPCIDIRTTHMCLQNNYSM